MRKRIRKNKFLLFGVIVVSMIIAWSCVPKDPGVLTPNQAPVAHLANVPNDDTVTVKDSAKGTKSSLVKLYWVGNDADGFVTGFMYRWSFKDSNASSQVKYRRWSVVLNYVPLDKKIIMLDIDSAETFEKAPKILPQIYKFFANSELDPDKKDTLSPAYDSSIVNTYRRLESGQKIIIQGIKLYASNPDNERYPIHRSPNAGLFIFESNDTLNRHKFEIIAVDNEGVAGNTDSVRFWTKIVERPRINFVSSPSLNDSVFILFNTTLTWNGLRFRAKADDKNSRTWEYQWRVDTKDWSSWSAKLTDPFEAVVTASNVDTPYTRSHTFYIHARNEFGAMSPDSSRVFKTVYPGIAIPGWPKKVLIINLARANGGPPQEPEGPAFPGIARMNAFYREVFDSTFFGDTTHFTLWPGPGQPPLSRLASYSSIIVLQGNWRSAPQTANKIKANDFAKYLDIGGNLLWDGMNAQVALQVIDDPIPVFYRIGVDVGADLSGLSIPNGYYYCRDTIFAGAFPNKGYPAISLDTSKLSPLWDGAIAKMSALRPSGFGERIYLFDSNCDTCSTRIQGDFFVNFAQPPLQTIGIRYLGATFKSVYLGFPLYYVNRDQAIQAVRKAMRDLGEL